jgi:hypothetical protein
VIHFLKERNIMENQARHEAVKNLHVPSGWQWRRKE